MHQGKSFPKNKSATTEETVVALAIKRQSTWMENAERDQLST